MSARKTLDSLRREIDEIDDALHDLIVRRTKAVEGVRDLKLGQKIKIRPAREVQILHRLVARHKGPFPKRELVRIWRELIVATLSFEGPFSVAVHMPEFGSGYWDLARDHYGSFTPMTGHASPRRVIEAVRSQEATVGIVPLPAQDETDPWWPYLATTSPDAPRVVARLPFAGPGNGRDADLNGLVICPLAAEPTGRDRSLIAIEAGDDIALASLGPALAKAGLPVTFTAQSDAEQAPGTRLYLAEVDDFAGEDDRRIMRYLDAAGSTVTRVVGLGSYAVPLTPEQLALPPAKKKPARKKAPRRKAARS
jgi:chorismate mutase/prephenate dehydratase